jgi:hypothetical protein
MKRRSAMENAMSALRHTPLPAGHNGEATAFVRPLWFALLLVGLLAVASCRESGGEGDFFEVSGKLVVFNYRVATATFLVTLKPLKPIVDGDTAVATFQNPAGGEDIVVNQKVWPKLDKLTIETPPLRCIVKDKPYSASIKIVAADGTVKQTIETAMTSSQDQSVLPDRPLVVGPVYTPNPELAGHPDGRLPADKVEPCPSAT